MKLPIRPSQVILLLVCLNIGLGFIVLIRYLLTDLETQTLQASEEIMVDVSARLAQQVEHHISPDQPFGAELCAQIFPTSSPELSTEVKIYNLNKKKVGLSHYITDAQGRVIFDSNGDQLKGENHADFNNVFKTLRGEYGARSTRLDEDDECSSIMYVGAPIRQGGEIIGVLSVYKAQRDIMPFVLERRSQILTVCIFMAIGIILFVAGVFFWVYSPIGKLTRYARDVIDGQRPTFPKLGKGREINTLGTALRTMREALEGRAYAKNYVQTLSHELKSPISAIKASAELLEEDLPAEQRDRFLKTIVSEVERSEKVLSRLQQLSLMEGMSELERSEKVPLHTLLEGLMTEYAPIAKAKEVPLQSSLTPISYLGDSFLLRAAFQNLLENAIKFSPHGAQVEVSLTKTNEHVHVAVSNGGELVPEYARERIFDRLYSLQNTPQGKGSGIGLALVKEAVELHQGKVRYCTQEGQNSFLITLPHGES